MRSFSGLIAISLLGCVGGDIEDPQDDVFMTDDAKADAFGVEDWSPDGAAVLRLVSTSTASKLHDDVGLSSTVAKAIVTARGTLPHGEFSDLDQLDDVPNVGKTVFDQLRRYATDHHLYKTSLRIPLLVEDADTEKLTPITAYNAAAHSAGLPGFARYTFVDDSTHYADKMNTYNTRLKEVAKQAHITINGEMLVYAYGLYQYEHVCFIGNPLQVGDVAQAQSDDVVGDMYTVQAWRYKTKKWMVDEGEDQYGDDFAHYNTSSNFVRVIYTNDDDGTNLSTDDVPPCR